MIAARRPRCGDHRRPRRSPPRRWSPPRPMPACISSARSRSPTRSPRRSPWSGAVAAAGVTNMVLFTWRWQPHWRYVKHLVDTGYIGRCYRARFAFVEVHRARARATSGASTAGAAPASPGDLGSHMIDMAHWFFGDVASVSADLRTVRRPVGGGRSAAASGQRCGADRDDDAERRRRCWSTSSSVTLHGRPRLPGHRRTPRRRGHHRGPTTASSAPRPA